MRRCWRGYKIAINGRNSDGRDDEKRVEYAWRIVSLCKLLNIEAPYFSELDIEEEEEEVVEADEDEDVLADKEGSSRRRPRSKMGANDGHEGVNEENYYYNNDESGDDQYPSQENFTGW